MPYRKTNSLTKGRREEKERKLNTYRPIIDKGGSIAKVYHQPQNSGITAIVKPANNTRPERSGIDSSWVSATISVSECLSACGKSGRSMSSNKRRAITPAKFLKYNESTVYPLNTRVSVCHPEPAPRSLRRRISHVQTKGGYQYAD